jgi:hypothetical protein
MGEFLFAEIRFGSVEGLRLTEVLHDIAKEDWYGGQAMNSADARTGPEQTLR